MRHCLRCRSSRSRCSATSCSRERCSIAPTHFIGDALAAFSRELAAERRSAGTVEAAMQTTVDEVRFRDLEIVILDSARHVVAMTALSDDDPVPPGRQMPVSKIGSTIVTVDSPATT